VAKTQEHERAHEGLSEVLESAQLLDFEKAAAPTKPRRRRLRAAPGGGLLTRASRRSDVGWHGRMCILGCPRRTHQRAIEFVLRLIPGSARRRP
jgi:hypothetical protein